MESMQVQGQGDKVTLHVTVPMSLIEQLPRMLMPRTEAFKN